MESRKRETVIKWEVHGLLIIVKRQLKVHEHKKVVFGKVSKS